MRWLLAILLSSHVLATPWQILVNVDLTTSAKQGGQAIVAGAQLAIDDINAEGGLLGRSVELVIANHRANPARGIFHWQQAASNPNVLVVLGGVHTPVALAELETIHQSDLLYLIPWAAGTGIVSHDYQPNQVFRLSVRDQWAGPLLFEQAYQAGCRQPHFFLERTGWGRSNEQALVRAAQEAGIETYQTHWFNWQSAMMPVMVQEISEDVAGHCIIFVGNTLDAVNLLTAVDQWRPRLPVFSHWGIVADDFVSMLPETVLSNIELVYLNTISPKQPKTAAGEAFLARYQARYGMADNSFNGAAHSYDLLHLFAQAVHQAQSTEEQALRQALYQLEPWQGVLRTYQQPFSVDDHEALTASDLLMLRLDSDQIGVP